ncbi:hypothetical protein LCGC14_1847810 [marine sediment metagenome]|uniref:Uncharacterized protein n=1 Tax=marine sediment metagenome TaxID=412755 RepID=A0A0F9IQU9_9ZZZZ
MRKTTAILVVVLCCSLALNVFFFSRMCVLRKASQRSQMFLAAKGHGRGVADAKRDFAAGIPKWYMIGDFGVAVPSDKPGRKLATAGCMVTEYEKTYVDSYNKTTDELFETQANQKAAQP